MDLIKKIHQLTLSTECTFGHLLAGSVFESLSQDFVKLFQIFLRQDLGIVGDEAMACFCQGLGALQSIPENGPPDLVPDFGEFSSVMRLSLSVKETPRKVNPWEMWLTAIGIEREFQLFPEKTTDCVQTAFSFFLAAAEDDEVVGIADISKLASVSVMVKGFRLEIGKQWGDEPSLRDAEPAVLHCWRLSTLPIRTQTLMRSEKFVVVNPFGQHPHEPIMIDRVKVIVDIAAG